MHEIAAIKAAVNAAAQIRMAQHRAGASSTGADLAPAYKAAYEAARDTCVAYGYKPEAAVEWILDRMTALKAQENADLNGVSLARAQRASRLADLYGLERLLHERRIAEALDDVARLIAAAEADI